MPDVVHDSDPSFDPAEMSLIAQSVVAHPRVTHEADLTAGALVLALTDELLVHPSADVTELNDNAVFGGTLSGGVRSEMASHVDPAHDIQVWRLRPTALALGDSIFWARKLRQIQEVKLGGKLVSLATITPHHITVVSHYDTCPYGEPTPAAAPDEPWLEPFDGDPSVQVVVIDTGLIEGNAELERRGGITAVAGSWLDTSTDPGTWRPSDPDTEDADGDRRLDGVAGHGMFVAGLVARQCAQAKITVVGHRHDVLAVPDPAACERSTDESTQPDPDEARLFTSEISVAASLVNHLDAHVISCGFAFPALDGYPSLGTWAALSRLGHGGRRPAIVAPAGNEDTTAPYWPAAHPAVIGVAATDVDDDKADFSNWGDWLDCCACGQDVLSTYLTWDGEDDTGTDVVFEGWATWNGTCFAAPKVTGAIARLVAGNGLTPPEAFDTMVAESGGPVAGRGGAFGLPHFQLG